MDKLAIEGGAHVSEKKIPLVKPTFSQKDAARALGVALKWSIISIHVLRTITYGIMMTDALLFNNVLINIINIF